jgi:hypothetical protein
VETTDDEIEKANAVHPIVVDQSVTEMNDKEVAVTVLIRIKAVVAFNPEIPARRNRKMNLTTTAVEVAAGVVVPAILMRVGNEIGPM